MTTMSLICLICVRIARDYICHISFKIWVVLTISLPQKKHLKGITCKFLYCKVQHVEDGGERREQYWS